MSTNTGTQSKNEVWQVVLIVAALLIWTGVVIASLLLQQPAIAVVLAILLVKVVVRLAKSYRGMSTLGAK